MKLPPPLASLDALQRFLGLALLLLLLFSLPLWHLARFALGSQLYSYILLIPFVSAYLFRLYKEPLPPTPSPAWIPSSLLIIGALLLALGPAIGILHPGNGAEGLQNTLSTQTTAFVLCLWAAAFLCLGWQGVKARFFPLAFLITFIPMPSGLEMGLETFLQHGSADVAGALFSLSGMTVFRDGQIFQLPGITLEVAPECSGIHSTVVLFVTSLVAGHLFLKSFWSKFLLSAFVLPLALLRNGFRVWVLGELCVHINPSMIDSWIHHHGGPLFFALSLIPFGALLYYLYKREHKASVRKTSP